MYLLDTNVVSELRRPQPDARVLAWVQDRFPGDLFLSAISVFELELGVRRVERRDVAQGERLRRWLDGGVLDQFRGRVLPVDAAVARRSAMLQVPDPRSERDCFIAATALEHSLTVVTRNVRDFAPTGVPIVDPWS